MLESQDVMMLSGLREDLACTREAEMTKGTMTDDTLLEGPLSLGPSKRKLGCDHTHHVSTSCMRAM